MEKTGLCSSGSKGSQSMTATATSIPATRPNQLTDCPLTAPQAVFLCHTNSMENKGTRTMTKREAKANFLAVSVEEKLNDKPAMRFAWGVYTDLLCKEGYITMKQYESWCCPF